MRLRTHVRPDTLRDRLVWQCTSLLLDYPDQQRFDTIDELLAHLSGDAAKLLGRTVSALKSRDPSHAATDYVSTFDLRRRCTMYLTYWTAGDTRNRGPHMLAFARAYRRAGVEPPPDEAPDFLPVVLEFAATVHPVAGRQLLADHRVSIEVLREALTAMGSPYAHAVTAVGETLPAIGEVEVLRARRLAQDGPPAESVGLQPFTLGMPSRREGNR